MQNIPVVDLGRHRARRLNAGDRTELARACEDHGFFLLRGHQCDALIDRVFAASADFFAAPRSLKNSVARNAENPLGYYDRELTKQHRDQKEVFDFKAGGHESRNPARRTRWPDEMPEFRETLTMFFSAFTELSKETMAMVLEALGMPQTRIAGILDEGFGERHSSSARLNFYPAYDPVPAAEQQGLNSLGDMALHHHTDPGAITLLLQDDHGGLQALSRTDGWIDVPPASGTVVVNVGDVLQVWTNDRCTAGVHRVLPVGSGAGRYSTPFFYQPRFDAEIAPWVTTGEQARYRPFSWREFIRGRVTDNYADYGEDDIQIDRYRSAV